MDIRSLLISVYEHYYSNVYEKGFRLNEEKNSSLIDKFLFELLKAKGYHYTSIGENFLNNYFRFQFDYWKEKETERNPSISWFIGAKAVDRYFNVEDRQLSEYWVSKNTSNIPSYKAPESQISEYEIAKRKTNKLKSETLLSCIESTSLYVNHIVCITCKSKIDCKKILKQNYPLLYRKRGLNKFNK